MNFKQNYIITKETSALIPAKQIDYDTIVLQANGATYYVRETPLCISQVKSEPLQQLDFEPP